MNISDVIAFLALCLSGFALWQNHRTNQRQLPLIKLQEQLNQIQLAKENSEASLEKKADIKACYTALERLKIWNDGLSNARNVRILFDEESGTPLIDDDVTSKFPMEILEPGQKVELITAIDMQTPLKHCITVEWEDDSKVNNSKTLSLTL